MPMLSEGAPSGTVDQSQWTEMPDTFDRHYFAQYLFIYEDGDHVVFGGPTQISGKTQLAFDLLEYAATPSCPAYVAVSKPRDKVTSYYAKIFGARIVREWPPKKQIKEFFGHKYRMYIVWPRFGNINTDHDNAYRVLSRLIADRYAAGARKGKKAESGILVMDDTRDKEKVIHLKHEMTQVLAMAGAMGLGEWCFVQKGSEQGETARMAYPNAKHVFLFYDPTVSGQAYYGDIGGVDPNYLIWVLKRLKPRQALYIRRDGPVMCIVDSDSRHGKITNER